MSINEVRYLTECGSTNAYVKEHFEEFGPVERFCISLHTSS